MATETKPDTIKGWLLNNQPVTWAAHGLLACIVGGLGIGFLYHWATPSMPHVVAYALGTTMAALAYLAKELFKDKPSHKAKGDWRTPDWLGVTPIIDMYGDAIVPIACAVSAWFAVFAEWMLR